MSTFMRTSPTQCASFIRFTVRCSMFYCFLCVLFHVSPAYLLMSLCVSFLLSVSLLHAVHTTCEWFPPLNLGAYICGAYHFLTRLRRNTFQKLSAIFDVGRRFYHLTLSQYDFES
ncbi:hypothetical protein BD769DRAFT_1391385 [Suillus cothurnatus]|nr:hypothetical protein BD769DRAFT_1392800 [Suillus cothurnatus]KAG2114883.1 hypothetical protein BD769DRAFT_1391385 [Suillus cothurnatus]